MAKNSLVTLCCQNPEYRCTGSDYGLHSCASAFTDSASVMVLGCPKKEEEEEEEIIKWCFGHFQVSHLKYAIVVASIQADTLLYAAYM